MEIKEKKIVTIGGGSGQFILLSGLRDLENIYTTAIVQYRSSNVTVLYSVSTLYSSLLYVKPWSLYPATRVISHNTEVFTQSKNTHHINQLKNKIISPCFFVILYNSSEIKGVGSLWISLLLYNSSTDSKNVVITFFL